MKDTKSKVILVILDPLFEMLRLLFHFPFVAEVSDLRPGVGSSLATLPFRACTKWDTSRLAVSDEFAPFQRQLRFVILFADDTVRRTDKL